MTQIMGRTEINRRIKTRFPIEREMRYKIVQNGVILESGNGQTLNLSSSGIAFVAQRSLPTGVLVELSISWPVKLADACPMRLVVFGRIVRTQGCIAACTIEKYEFRTQARYAEVPMPARNDEMLRRWADSVREKEKVMTAHATA